MSKGFLLPLGAALWLGLAGCGVHISTSSGSWSGGDLAGATNVVVSGEIPGNLTDLEVDNSFGGVRVTGTESGPRRWTWKLTVRARTDAEAQEIAEDIICHSNLAGGHLGLAVTLPNLFQPHSIRSDFEITVPRAASARTRNRFGPTEIDQLGGDVEAFGQNGRVQIQHVAGHVHGQTSFDSLDVSDTGPAVLKNQNGRVEADAVGGSLEARTSFGPVTARDIAGSVLVRDQNGRVEIVRARGDADIRTSFARLSVEDIEGKAVLENQNGEIEASGVTGVVKAGTSFAALNINGGGPEFICHNQNGAIRLRSTSTNVNNIEARTSFAPIELHLPDGVKPALVAHTSFGNIESDYPVIMKPAGQGGLAEVEPASLRANLQDQNGNIRVSRD